MTGDECAAGWDGQPGVTAYAQAAFESLVALAEASGFEIAGSRAWDFGCGTGFQPGPRYDLVVCSSVCAFVDDYEGLVHRLVSSMRPGGLFVQWDWELDPRDDEPFGLSRDAIRSALGDAGLVSVSVETGFEVAVEDQTMKPLMGAGRAPHHERS